MVLAGLAPWHTGDLSWLDRTVQFVAATLFWELAIASVSSHARQWLDAAWLQTPLGFSVVVGVASVPATAAMIVVFLRASSPPGEISLFYIQSLLLGLVVAFARRGLRQNVVPVTAVAAAKASDASETDKRIRFLRRHVPSLAMCRLRALQAEDHYLRIHTDGGSQLVLLRMRDAVAELGDEAGWQPHRSFWLAADAGGHAVRRGQAWQIMLDTGLTVPVSKSATQAMRDAGYASTGDRASLG